MKKKIKLFFSYIKDYDGGTLMEAYCNPEINYSELSETVKLQKEIVKSMMNKFLNVKHKNKFSHLEKILTKHKKEV